MGATNADLAPRAWIARFAEFRMVPGDRFTENEISVHLDVTVRIRIIRRLDFPKQARIDATYDEHAKLLQAIQHKRGDQAAKLLRAHIEISQAEVRKITLHQVHMARRAELAPRAGQLGLIVSGDRIWR